MVYREQSTKRCDANVFDVVDVKSLQSAPPVSVKMIETVGVRLPCEMTSPLQSLISGAH